MIIRELLTKWSFDIEHEKLEKAEHSLEGIKERLEFLGAVEVLKGLAELTERFSEFAEKLHVMSESAGLTVEEFQKLSFAASQSAVSQDELGQAMGRLSRNLYDARKGSEEANRAFALAGISGQQIAGFKNSRDALLALSDRFKSIQDPIKKQALAMELLGRGSINMVALLSKGSGAIRGMGDEAERLGILLSGEQVEALVSVEHSLQKFWLVLKNIGATIAVYLAPIINTAISAFLKFYEVNKGLLDLNIKGWAEDFAYVLGFIFGLFQGVTTRILEFGKAHQVLVRRVFEVFLAFMTLSLAAAGVFRVFSLIKSIFGLWTWVIPLITKSWGLFSIAMERVGYMFIRALPAITSTTTELWAMLAPILPIVAAIGLLIVAAHDLYKAFQGQRTWVQGFIEWLGIADEVQSVFFSIFDILNDILHLDFSKLFSDLIGDLQGVGKWFSSLGGLGKLAVGAIPGLGPLVAASSALAPAAVNAAPGAASAASSLGLLGEGALPGAGPSASPAVEAALSGQNSSQNISINAPLTIEASPGMDEKQLAKMAHDQHKEHLDRVIREATRSLTPALAQ